MLYVAAKDPVSWWVYFTGGVGLLVAVVGGAWGIWWSIRQTHAQIEVIPRLWDERNEGRGRARLEVRIVNRSDKVPATVDRVRVDAQEHQQSIDARQTSDARWLPVRLPPKEAVTVRFMESADEVNDARWAHAQRVVVETAEGGLYSHNGGRILRYCRHHYPKARPGRA